MGKLLIIQWRWLKLLIIQWRWLKHLICIFSTIADRLRTLIPSIPFDTSKLHNFVRSRIDESVTFSIPSITETDVIGFLLKIDSNKSTSIDGISSRMLKLAALIIAPSLAKLINLSFSLNQFPEHWKTARITPI